MRTWQLAVLVAAILLAGLLNGGVYQVTGATAGNLGETNGYRINRFTGRTWAIWGDRGVQGEVVTK